MGHYDRKFHEVLNSKKHRLQAQQCIQRPLDDGAIHMVKDQVYRCAAQFLTQHALKERHDDFLSYYTLDMLVFSPGEFQDVIRECALDYSMRQRSISSVFGDQNDASEKLRQENEKLKGIMRKLVSHTQSGELAMIVTGTAAVDAAREYVDMVKAGDA